MNFGRNFQQGTWATSQVAAKLPSTACPAWASIETAHEIRIGGDAMYRMDIIGGAAVNEHHEGAGTGH